MFKLHKPQLSGSIHSGHFMVSRLDDDDDDNNDPADDSSESERDNANSVEIDVNNPDSVVDATNLDLTYRVESPSAKDEHLTSWNDLDKPARHSQKQQYLTYYTNSYSEEARSGASTSKDIDVGGNSVTGINLLHDSSKDMLASGLNSHLSHLHQHHHIQDNQKHHLQQIQLQQQHHQHHQHAVTIDTSLTKLLQCMSLYYSSKLTSPKWKSFKGLKLRLKYKIRLNNLIWRAWFLQCVRGRHPPGCQFTAPVEIDVHKKDETIVLEGKYWKRKEKAISDEYKKWRIFHKQKSQMICFRPVSRQAIRTQSLSSGCETKFAFSVNNSLISHVLSFESSLTFLILPPPTLKLLSLLHTYRCRHLRTALSCDKRMFARRFWYF